MAEARYSLIADSELSQYSSYDIHEFWLAQIGRYITLVSLTALIWDSILMFGREKRFVWGKLPWYVQSAYATNKLGIGLVVSTYLWMTVPLNSWTTETCLRSMWLITVLYSISDAAGNAMIMFRIFILWGRSRKVKWYLMSGALAVFGSTIAMAIYICSQDGNTVSFNEPRKMCIATIRTRLFSVIFIGQAVFDIFVGFLVFLNAMDIPRTCDKSLIKLLTDQGIIVVAITFILRIVDVAMGSTDEPSLSLIGMTFVATLIEILNTRLLVKLVANASAASGQSQHDSLPFLHDYRISDIPSGYNATLANDSDGFELDSMGASKVSITY